MTHRVCDINLSWDASATEPEKLDRIEIDVVETGSGIEQTFSFDPSVTTMDMTVHASQRVIVRSRVYDKDGEVAIGVEYNINVPDGVAPQPLTNFRHTFVGFRDVEHDDEPVPPPTE